VEQQILRDEGPLVRKVRALCREPADELRAAVTRKLALDQIAPQIDS
jgi:hypothetical protein